MRVLYLSMCLSRNASKVYSVSFLSEIIEFLKIETLSKRNKYCKIRLFLHTDMIKLKVICAIMRDNNL